MGESDSQSDRPTESQSLGQLDFQTVNQTDSQRVSQSVSQTNRQSVTMIVPYPVWFRLVPGSLSLIHKCLSLET